MLVNGSDKAHGGPYTRVDPGNDKKTALDLCIVSKELYKYVDSLIIDKDRNFTPYRSVNKKSVKYTDHYSVLISFKDIPLTNTVVSSKSIVRWNTNRDGGWNKFKEMTENNRVFNKVSIQLDGDADTMMKDINKELKHIDLVHVGS